MRFHTGAELSYTAKVHLTSKFFLQPSKNYFVPDHIGEKINDSYQAFPFQPVTGDFRHI